MKKISAFAFTVAAAMATQLAGAQEYTLLTTPADVYAHSSEDVSGAKDAFLAVLDNAESTDEQKIAAMQAYQQNATPAPGYGFDMTYLMSYTAVNADNQGKYTQAMLAENWHSEIDGASFQALANSSHKEDGPYIRVYSASAFKEAASFGKFLAYQDVALSTGRYILSMDAYAQGAAACATVSAGDTNSTTTIAGYGNGPVSYSLDFKVAAAANVKLGVKRNDKAGNLTHIWFNNIELHKVSSVIVITDEATGGLAAAEDATVQLNRTMSADEYTPICLPFIIENWRDIFDDLLQWTTYTDKLVFATIKNTNTQARKPYLAKPKTDITPDNYLTFANVTITTGTPGSWVKSVGEGESPYPVLMAGNWAAGTVPANCYYLEDGIWKLSDGTAPLPAFSAYIDATGLSEHPETILMDTGNGTASLIENTFASETPAFVNVYNLQGMLIRQNVATESALDGLAAGIYIVNGKKISKR